MKVIVLNLPACNINWLGAYGNEWIRTPHLDRLAGEGVVFDQHHSTNPDPEAVERTWHTGDYQLPGSTRPAIDRLSLFERHGVPFQRISDAPIDGAEIAESGEIVDVVLDAVAEVSEQPSWLIWVDAHRLLPPWDIFDELFEEYTNSWIPPQSFDEIPDLEPIPDPDEGPFDVKDVIGREELQLSFGAVMSALDLEIGGLIEEAHERGFDEGVTWIVTSGYGWPLAEHHVIGPVRAEVHEESVHVPLIIRFADGRQSGRRIHALTQTIDLLPTLLRMFEIPESEWQSPHGRDLSPLITGEVETVRDYAFFGSQMGEQVVWGVRTTDWCFQSFPETNVRRLYEKPADRWEMNDLQQHHLDWCDQLELMRVKFIEIANQPTWTAWPTLPSEETEDDDDSDRASGG